MKTKDKELLYTRGELWIDDDDFIACGKGDNYISFASTNVNDLDIDERRANAELIIKAVNMHEELVHRLKQILSDLETKKENREGNWEQIAIANISLTLEKAKQK